MIEVPADVHLRGRRAVAVFLAFAFAYLLSTLLRAVTATLAPAFSVELGLSAGQLGLLAGAYFLGFALTQLPLGSALDRWGPRRVLVSLLLVATVGCFAFAGARTLMQLLASRWLTGVGVSACLMAPLTCYRHVFSAAAQVRANAWMLMTGSLGMLASTVPVQWLLPLLGWRGLFVGLGVVLLLGIVLLWRLVPADAPAEPSPGETAQGYRQVFGHAAFLRLAPMGFVAYGGLLAMQTLWIGPWLTQVGGQDATAAARGLFVVNASMLLAFLCWGLIMPRLVRMGWGGDRLIAWAWPPAVCCLGWILWQGAAAGAGSWAAWCVLTSVITLSQPALGQAFPPALAGRALSAFNLVIFSGVFVVQWGIGLGMDALRAHGYTPVQAFKMTLAGFLLACVLSFLWLNLSHWRERRG